MLKRILLRGGLLACLLPVILFSQTSPPRKARPAPLPTGLKILSTTLDPQSLYVIVKAQNVTDKTVVAYELRYQEFDKDGNQVNDAGGGIDFAEPGNSPTNTRNFILPGQIGTIEGYLANRGTITVKATVRGVVYEDRSYEGPAAQIFFNTRQARAREAREQAAKETGTKKTELEKRAEWYESHGPKEGAQQ